MGSTMVWIAASKRRKSETARPEIWEHVSQQVQIQCRIFWDERARNREVIREGTHVAWPVVEREADVQLVLGLLGRPSHLCGAGGQEVEDASDDVRGSWGSVLVCCGRVVAAMHASEARTA
jgi:hypothetical protein